MSLEATSRVHWSFWVIAVVALIWNLMGAMNFFMQMFSSDVSNMPDWWQAVVASRPGWVTGAMAIAVFVAVLGCVALLLRKAGAYHLFIVSLVGVIITMGHALSVGLPGPLYFILGVVMPIGLSVFMIWYVKLAEGKGWIS